MEHKTWTTTDKSDWGDGPWQDEPDKEQWADEATGYACLMKRSRMSGSLCGYVGVPEGHPWYGADYGSISTDVHGELTYGSKCQDGPDEFTICHVPGPGEPDHLYWLGFDCGHAGDIMPAMEARTRDAGLPSLPNPYFEETYKPVAYVKAECARLAKQAAEAAPVPA